MLFSRSIPTLTQNLRHVSDSSVFIHTNSHCPQSNLWQQHSFIRIHTAHNLTSDSSVFILMNSHCPHLLPVPSSGHPMQLNAPTPNLTHTCPVICAWEPTSIHPYLTINPKLLTATYSSIWIHTAHIFLLSHHPDIPCNLSAQPPSSCTHSSICAWETH